MRFIIILSFLITCPLAVHADESKLPSNKKIKKLEEWLQWQKQHNLKLQKKLNVEMPAETGNIHDIYLKVEKPSQNDNCYYLARLSYFTQKQEERRMAIIKKYEKLYKRDVEGINLNYNIYVKPDIFEMQQACLLYVFTPTTKQTGGQ